MSRPTLEVADIVRAVGNRFWEKHKSHFAWLHRKVLDAIVRCRTAALGGHLDKCVDCGHQAISYNSCRNRNCPNCSALSPAQIVPKQQASRVVPPAPAPCWSSNGSQRSTLFPARPEHPYPTEVHH
jgi:Transposase zinc-binding domain